MNHARKRILAAWILLLCMPFVQAREEKLIDTEDQKVMSSRTFLEAHPDMKYRTEGWFAYDEGRHAQALAAFTRAAGYGDKLSQAMLAEMAWNGQGQPVDRGMAYAWADIAAERGYRQFVALREKYWNQLTDEEKTRALEVGQRLLAQYSDEVTRVALAGHLRRARQYMLSGRPRKDAIVRVPDPYGMATDIRGHDFYAEKFWNPTRYQEWVDEVWMDPPRENVDVGAPETVGKQD